MYILGYQILTSSNYVRARKWVKLITITGSTQIVIQLIGFLCGILVIRVLPVHEYALYTLANTMLGTLTILADGGISTGVMGLGSKVWQDREKLGVVLVTGLKLRKKFAFGSLLIATPVLYYLLRYHEASWLTSLLVIASLIPAFFSALTDNMLQVAPQLRQDIIPLQKNQIAVNLGRLSLLGLTLFVFPWAFVAVLAAGLPQIIGNFNLRKITFSYADWQQKPNFEVQKEILNVVKKLLPGAIYFCISGQITIWIISIYGSTSTIAQVGALGRLAMILTLISMIVQVLVIPRFIKLENNRKLLLNKYLSVHAILFLIGFFIVTLAGIFSSQFLWILGKQYSGLNYELILQIAGSYLGMMVGISFNLNINRGWIMNPLLGIFIGLAGIFIGITLMDVSTLTGILLFNIFTGLIGIVAYSGYGLLRIVKV